MKKAAAIPMTNALRALSAAGVAADVRTYAYTERGGTIQAATLLGLDHHATIKTIVLEDETKKPFVCLMHGDCEISLKNLARARGCKTVAPCAPATADRHSGYHVGGTSPFGTKRAMTVYVQSTIYALPEIYINAGHRGLLVAMKPGDIDVVLAGRTVPVDVAIRG
jgi:Cys-tRNA(Pro) deacylase